MWTNPFRTGRDGMGTDITETARNSLCKPGKLCRVQKTILPRGGDVPQGETGQSIDKCLPFSIFP